VNHDRVPLDLERQVPVRAGECGQLRRCRGLQQASIRRLAGAKPRRHLVRDHVAKTTRVAVDAVRADPTAERDRPGERGGARRDRVHVGAAVRDGVQPGIREAERERDEPRRVSRQARAQHRSPGTRSPERHIREETLERLEIRAERERVASHSDADDELTRAVGDVRAAQRRRRSVDRLGQLGARESREVVAPAVGVADHPRGEAEHRDAARQAADASGETEHREKGRVDAGAVRGRQGCRDRDELRQVLPQHEVGGHRVGCLLALAALERGAIRLREQCQAQADDEERHGDGRVAATAGQRQRGEPKGHRTRPPCPLGASQDGRQQPRGDDGRDEGHETGEEEQ